jgi:hypothetical protein
MPFCLLSLQIKDYNEISIFGFKAALSRAGAPFVARRPVYELLKGQVFWFN